MRYQSIESQSGAQELLKKNREGVSIGVVYRGKVIDNNDPSGTGRVKIDIKSLYANIKEEDIPWALPCFASASYNAGSFIVPQVGDNVWVLFERNDIFKPVYIGFMYTTGSSMATPVGSSYAPAYENNVPQEGVNPNHYIVMKTPKGSGLWMDDEDGSLHIVSADGGTIEFSEDRTTLAYKTGGSISSQDQGVLLITPEGGYILLTDGDEQSSEPSIILKREGTQISIIQDKKIELVIGDKRIVLDEESDNIKIHYNDSTDISLSDNRITAKVSGASMVISDDVVNISASSTININAPSVNITGDD